MKADAGRSFQMMTCPTETTSLISWPLFSASVSSFRNDRAGSLSYASKCLTNRYQHLIVNCCIFSINLVQYKNAPSFSTHAYRTNADTQIVQTGSLIGSHMSDRSILLLRVLKQSLLRSLFTILLILQHGAPRSNDT